MRCLTPRKVGFQDDGKTLAWTFKKVSKEYPTFSLPCGKCIECRLEYARSWAIRCTHEAQMHEKNSFITLTYSDQYLTSPKLQYKDFQDFAKRLREGVHRNHKKGEPEYERARISYFVTGEYGDQRKRPHWHALIFNWRPDDLKLKYTSDHGDSVYSSATLDTLWGRGIAEIGSVTFHSAGYCARYAAKKLIHGKDQEHAFHPISKKSSHRAIGKSWLEKYYKDAFSYGEIVLPGGQKCAIPRYYEKWLKQHHYEEYLSYLDRVKLKRISEMEAKTEKENLEYKIEVNRVRDQGFPHPIDKPTVKTILINEKFKRLQKYLKGDI